QAGLLVRGEQIPARQDRSPQTLPGGIRSRPIRYAPGQHLLKLPDAAARRGDLQGERHTTQAPYQGGQDHRLVQANWSSAYPPEPVQKELDRGIAEDLRLGGRRRGQLERTDRPLVFARHAERMTARR